jgi:hypothetical protein
LIGSEVGSEGYIINQELNFVMIVQVIHITQIKGEILTNDPTTIPILTILSFGYLDIQTLSSVV